MSLLFLGVVLKLVLVWCIFWLLLVMVGIVLGEVVLVEGWFIGVLVLLLGDLL